MTLLQRVRESLLGDSGTERIRYQCTVCYATFDTEESDGVAGCPSCGAARVRELANG